MTSLVATLMFVLLASAWWFAAARPGRSADRIPTGSRPTRHAVFGRGVLAPDGRWRPVGLPEPGPVDTDPGDGSGCPTGSPRDGVVHL